MTSLEPENKNTDRKRSIVPVICIMLAIGVFFNTIAVGTHLVPFVGYALAWPLATFLAILLGLTGVLQLILNRDESPTLAQRVRQTCIIPLVAFLVSFPHEISHWLSGALGVSIPSEAFSIAPVILASSLATTMPASRHSEILMDARLAPSGIALDGSRSHEYAWSQIEIVSQSSQMLMILVDGVPKIMATTGKNEAVARAIIANCRVRENYVRDLMGEKFVEEARSAPSIERKKAMREELAKKSGSKFGKFMLWRDIVPQSAEYVGNGAPRKRSLLPAITLAFLKGKLIEKALLIGACIFTVVYVPLELYWRLAHAANVPATIVEEVLTGAVVVGILGGIPSIAASIRAEEARIDALLDKSRGGAGIEA